jgi:hypothetical protein
MEPTGPRSGAAAAVALLRPAALVTATATAVAGCFRLGWDEETVRAGLSWFGTRRETIVPFVGGMLVTSTPYTAGPALLDVVEVLLPQRLQPPPATAR